MNSNIQKLLPLGAKQTEVALEKLTVTQTIEILSTCMNELSKLPHSEKSEPLVCLLAMACIKLGQINQRGKEFEPNIFQQ